MKKTTTILTILFSTLLLTTIVQAGPLPAYSQGTEINYESCGSPGENQWCPEPSVDNPYMTNTSYWYNTGDTYWGLNFDGEEAWGIHCGEGFIAGISSKYDDDANARMFMVKCGYNQGMDNGSVEICRDQGDDPDDFCTVSGETAPGVTCNDWTTENQEDYSSGIDCGQGYLAGVKAYDQDTDFGSSADDSKWQYQCCYPEGMNENSQDHCRGELNADSGDDQACMSTDANNDPYNITSWTSPNEWRQGSAVDCGNGFLVGMRSYHSGEPEEDRKFRYQCALRTVNTEKREYCLANGNDWSQKVNETDPSLACCGNDPEDNATYVVTNGNNQFCINKSWKRASKDYCNQVFLERHGLDIVDLPTQMCKGEILRDHQNTNASLLSKRADWQPAPGRCDVITTWNSQYLDVKPNPDADAPKYITGTSASCNEDTCTWNNIGCNTSSPAGGTHCGKGYMLQRLECSDSDCSTQYQCTFDPENCDPLPGGPASKDTNTEDARKAASTIPLVSASDGSNHYCTCYQSGSKYVQNVTECAADDYPSCDPSAPDNCRCVSEGNTENDSAVSHTGNRKEAPTEYPYWAECQGTATDRISWNNLQTPRHLGGINYNHTSSAVNVPNATVACYDESAGQYIPYTCVYNAETQRGEWVRDPVLKRSMDETERGYCPEENQCLLGLELDEGCRDTRYWQDNNYCLNGNWTSRTRMVAEKLLTQVDLNNDNFKLYCDDKARSLITTANTGETSEYCALVREDQPALVATHIGNEQDDNAISNYMDNLRAEYISRNPNANPEEWENNCDNETFGFEECAVMPNLAVYYDANSKIIMLSKEPGSYSGGFFATDGNTWDKIVRFFQSLIGIEQEFSARLQDFDKIYLQQRGDQRIKVLMENTYDIENQERVNYMTVEYQNIGVSYEEINNSVRAESSRITDNELILKNPESQAWNLLSGRTQLR